MSSNDFESDVRILPRSRGLVLESAADPRDLLKQETYTQNLAYVERRQYNDFLLFGDFHVEPNGIDNNFPENFRTLLDNVYIGHGVKRSLINLLISGGVGLYKEIKEGNRIIRDWQLDSEVKSWLEDFDFYNSYIPAVATDMVYVENMWTAFKRNKGARIGGKPFISALEHLSVQNMRLEYPNEQGLRTKAFYSEWLYSNLRTADIEAYPLFDRTDPFRNPISVNFSKMPTFGSTSYGRPTDISAVSLLKVLALLPNFHRANLTERGFKWVISIAKDYYEKVQNENGWSPESEEFKAWKEAFIDSIDEFLMAPEGDKLQTRFITEYFVDPHSYKTVNAVQITKLEDDTKELSQTGMDLHDTYSIGYVTANSINPQLANVHLKNHALSGSNLREAYEMHIKTATPTMRSILLGPVNAALKINFPKKDLQLGFMDIAFEDYTKNHTEKKGESANAIQQKR